MKRLIEAAEAMVAEHDGLPGANPQEMTWDNLRAAIADAQERGSTIEAEIAEHLAEQCSAHLRPFARNLAAGIVQHCPSLGGAP